MSGRLIEKEQQPLEFDPDEPTNLHHPVTQWPERCRNGNFEVVQIVDRPSGRPVVLAERPPKGPRSTD